MDLDPPEMISLGDLGEKFVKRVIRPATSLMSPTDGATCSVIVETSDSIHIKHDFRVGEVSNWVIGESDCNVMDKCLLTMKEGETSEFSFTEPFPLTITVNLKEYHVTQIYEMDNLQKFEKGKGHKEKGVELFKTNDITAAFHQFSKAIKFLIMINKYEEFPENLNMLKCQCYLNLAACQLKFPTSVDHVVTNCTKALNIDDSNVKGYVRRGQAHCSKGDYSAASRDFRKALTLQPDNRFVHNLLRKAEIERKNIINAS